MNRAFVLVLAVTALAGCSTFSTCPAPPRELQEAREIAPLTVPVGLEMPRTTEALRIPDLSGPERPRGEDDSCLDKPPSYFIDRRPGAEPREPKG